MSRALTALLKVNTAIFTPRVVTCVPGRVTVAFEGRHPPVIAVGAVIGMNLRGPHLRAPVRCDAQIVQRTEIDEGRLYTLHFPRECLEAEAIDAIYSERRAWMRVSPPSLEAVRILLTPVSASGRLRSEIAQMGHLVDVSGGGLAVELDGPDPDHLAGHDRVRVAFEPPGTDAHLERTCQIRRRSLYPAETGTRLRMGLEFEQPVTTLDFEPLWNCRKCGETRLLGVSHPRCCRCGTRRTGPTYLPEWDELIATASHRYTGNGRSCPSCGARWSKEASCCGLCGAGLEAEAWMEVHAG